MASLLCDEFEKEIKSKEKEHNYDIDLLLKHLYETKILHKDQALQNLLWIIFYDESFHFLNKKSALFYFLKTDPKKNIQLIIENYKKIKKRLEIEIILAKEIAKWAGPLPEKLKSLITESGNDRAREIIELTIKKKEKQKKEIIIKEAESFSNAKIIIEISAIKRKINTIAKENLGIESNLFPDTESIIDQVKVARDYNSLKNACIDLRPCIQKISSPEHNFDEKTALKKIPGAASQDLSKSINKFFLYLDSENINVNFNLFGLRDVNNITSLFAHPDKIKKLREVLKKTKMLDLYEKENWSVLHEKILQLYKKSLGDLSNEISKK